MYLEKGGDQGKGQVRMIRAQVFEGDINTPPVLGIPLEIHQQQLVNHHVETILGRYGACLEANQRSVFWPIRGQCYLDHQMQLLPQQGGEVIQTTEHNLQLVNMELDVTGDGSQALYSLQPHLQQDKGV